MSAGYSIGVDIGGTFTDVVCCAPDGTLRYAKFATTRDDESKAVLNALAYMAQTWGIEPSDITRFTHGTTVATNAVLERKGARLGLISTRGFRDQLEIGRQMRRQMYSVILDPETPVFLAPGSRRKEVRERIAADGDVLCDLDDQDLLQAVEELVSDGVEAISICFLFSFRNPVHERRACDLIAKTYPNVTVSVSHEVDPSFREYERMVVTAFDAYTKPVVDRYLARLEKGLVRAGIRAPLQVMQSRGGLMASPVARKRPVRLFLSGPAAGVIGGQFAGRLASVDDLITVDVGGTSCDISIVTSGRPMIRTEAMIDHFAVRVPMVNVNTIGAGGGSIARVDRGGALHVGPLSAGSEPGPACYGRGGSAPTVTDASVVLGYIDPENFAGGTLRLDGEMARRAIHDKIAIPMGVTLEQAAIGIHRLINAQMAEEIRLMSVRQGLDPRPFSILPMGGGGGLHAAALAQNLGISRVVIPRFPGVLSAIGLLAAPVEHEVLAYFGKTISETTTDDLTSSMRVLDEKCAVLMSDEQLDGNPITVLHLADICYVGQSYTLEVAFDETLPNVMERLYEDFRASHDRIRGHAAKSPAQIVNLRAVHRSDAGTLHFTSKPILAERATGSNRRVYFDGRIGATDTRIYMRSELPIDYSFSGPAIVEQPDTTMLVPPGWDGVVDQHHNIILKATTRP